jgi:hypothetical protein
MDLIFKKNILKSFKYALIFGVVGVTILFIDEIFLNRFFGNIFEPVWLIIIIPVIEIFQALPIEPDKSVFIDNSILLLPVIFVLFYSIVFFIIFCTYEIFKNLELKYKTKT